MVDFYLLKSEGVFAGIQQRGCRPTPFSRTSLRLWSLRVPKTVIKRVQFFFSFTEVTSCDGACLSGAPSNIYFGKRQMKCDMGQTRTFSKKSQNLNFSKSHQDHQIFET